MLYWCCRFFRVDIFITFHFQFSVSPAVQLLRFVTSDMITVLPASISMNNGHFLGIHRNGHYMEVIQICIYEKIYGSTVVTSKRSMDFDPSSYSHAFS